MRRYKMWRWTFVLSQAWGNARFEPGSNWAFPDATCLLQRLIVNQALLTLHVCSSVILWTRLYWRYMFAPASYCEPGFNRDTKLLQILLINWTKYSLNSTLLQINNWGHDRKVSVIFASQTCTRALPIIYDACNVFSRTLNQRRNWYDDIWSEQGEGSRITVHNSCPDLVQWITQQLSRPTTVN